MGSESFFVEGVIYELVAVSYAGSVHVAPLGVWRRGDMFEAAIYHDTTTYGNLKRNPRMTLNAVRSGLLFYEAVYAKDSVRTVCEGEYWFMPEAELWVGVRVFTERPEGGRSVFRFEQTAMRVQGGPPRPYTRADGALIEMLVHASRIEPYLKQGLRGRAEELYALIRHYYELVARVAPNTKYHEYAKAVYEEAARRMGGGGGP